MSGDLIYEYAPLVTNIVEYGTSADALFAGETPAPEGARLDLTLEGPIGGPKLNGTVKGKDYICFRADDKAQLHIHAEITTDDGKKIALFADGVAIGSRARRSSDFARTSPSLQVSRSSPSSLAK